MAIIVVGGRSKGVGKTTLACGLIAALPEFHWTAVKVSTHAHDKTDSIWEESVAAQGTDTARYLAAGAARSFLATPPSQDGWFVPDFPALLQRLSAVLGRGANVIFESNSIVQHVRFDLCLAVQGGLDQARSKPSFSHVVVNADAMVTHSDADRMLGGDGDSKPVFQLAALNKISPEMLEWLRKRLAATPRA
jgi:hypothetical protein